jgi:hypothetical protein
MALRQFIPSSPVAPPRWPSLVSSVGGEAAIRTFTAANAGEGGGANRWEAGIDFLPNNFCDDSETTPLSGVPCATDVFTAPSITGDEAVPSDVVYYWTTEKRSTFCSIEETRQKAKDILLAKTSLKLETELWEGDAHDAYGLEGQFFGSDFASVGDFTLVYALTELQEAWGQCSGGQRAMIHVGAFTASLWFTTGAIRRESGLLLDAFDNIVVAGNGYQRDTAYVTPVVDIHLSEIEVRDVIDQTNNTEWAVAYRAGLVKWDPCCQFSVGIDTSTLCG